MGFEITLFYTEEGNKEEVKTIKRKVGDPYEDTPLEKLASFIIAQRARRDIWITNVEIVEFKRSEVSFRETKGGIVIKNKKFSLDSDLEIQVEAIEEVKPISAITAAPNVPMHAPARPTTNTNLAPVNKPKKVLKVVMVDPDVQKDREGRIMPTLQILKGLGMPFTLNKRYQVFQEKESQTLGESKYFMMSDKGEIEVPSKYFVPAPTAEMQIMSGQSNDIALSYGADAYEDKFAGINLRR